MGRPSTTSFPPASATPWSGSTASAASANWRHAPTPADAARLLAALAGHGRSLAVAESFTGGRLLDRLTDVPGASLVLRGGVVAYADASKTRDLAVPEGLLLTHGAVSEPVALAMAQGARQRFAADFAVATTGIAGPTGATSAKPLGLSVCAAAGPTHRTSNVVVHAGSRSDVKRRAVDQAVGLLESVLRSEGIL